MNPLTIAGAEIRMDEDGRYCLNDLHRAAGGQRRHQPTNWLRKQQTIELGEEIAKSSDSRISPLDSKPGRNGSTFACKELVYAYAMWISPKFHLRVIRAYDSLVRTELDRLNGLHFRAVRAELEFLHGMQEASRCGIGLRQWRAERPGLEGRLTDLEREMQPGLFHQQPSGALPVAQQKGGAQ